MGSAYGSTKSPVMEHRCESDKTRMYVQARSEGDGMETKCNPEVSVRNNQSLSELPQNYTNVLPTTAKRKEPKFVPYEPYKAAVSPIIPANKDRMCIKKVVVDPSLIKPLASKVIKDIYIDFSPRNCEIPLNSLSAKPNAVTNEENELSSWLQEKVLLENRIQQLTEEKKEMETQFNIQTQVNTDLKKLLVASLGEDMQAKVQYMSEDKAKLGEHVLQCSQKLSENSEELEKLSVQCDMWKSKFQASSLLVDELAAWKVVLSRKFNEATEVIQYLLEEHQELHQQLILTFSTLHSIQEAFDLSAKWNSPCSQSPWNLSQLASATRTLSGDIQNRLLGSMSPRCNTDKLEQQQSFTRGEQLANKLLSSMDSLPAITKQEMNKKHSLGPGYRACSILPHSCSKEATVNCCRQCSGKVRLV